MISFAWILGYPKEASLFLSKLGIKGIRYPAGTLSGKRSVGIFDYVIFDEDDLEIKKVSAPKRITKRTLDNGITEVSIESASGAREVSLFRGDVRHGVTRRWYPSGQLKSETNYKYGRKEGPSRYWYENGQLKVEENYRSGVLHGQYVSYLENGNWATKLFYVNGQQHGWGSARGYYSPSETLEYYENGIKLKEIYYPNRRVKDQIIVTLYNSEGYATRLTKTEALEYVEKLLTEDDYLRFRKGRNKSATRNRASQSMKGQHATVVSSGAGAKVRKNLQELAKSYKNFSGRTRGFRKSCRCLGHGTTRGK